MTVDSIVLGIVGFGVSGSLGYTTAMRAPLESDSFVRKVLIGARDAEDHEILETFMRTSTNPSLRGFHESADIDSIAKQCDVVIFSYDCAIGVSRGNLRNLPPDYKRRMFNANIGPAIEYGKQFGRLKSDATMIICTNPVDMLAYYFNKAYWEERKGKPFPGKILGLNHTDTMRARQLVREYLDERGITPEQVQAEIIGTHDNDRMFLASSQAGFSRDGKYFPLASLEGFDKRKLYRILEDLKRLPGKILEDIRNTSDNTFNAILEVLKAMRDEQGICQLSYPSPFSKGSTPPFIGFDVNFKEDLRAFPEKEFLDSISREETASFEAETLRAEKELIHVEDRRAEVANHLKKAGKDARLAEFPKFFKELAVPLKTQVNEKSKGSRHGREDIHHEDWLHFLNFTHPFEEFHETRPKVRLAERAFYVDVIPVGGKNLVAVSHTCGVQVVDPVTGSSDNYAIEGEHPDGCCTIDDKVIASASNRGLFIAEKSGREGNLVPLKMFGEGFSGHVKSHDGVLYCSFDRSIISARIGRNGLVDSKAYSLPDRVRNFAIHPEADMLRIFATCRSGVYRLDLKTGSGDAGSGFVNIYHGALSSGRESRVNLVGVDYVFGNYYVVVSQDDKLLLLDRNAKNAAVLPDGDFQEDNAIKGKFNLPGDISHFSCDVLGGIVVASNRPGVGLFRLGKSGDKIMSSRIALPPHDLTGYVVKSDQYVEFRRLNSIALYSEFR